MERRSSRVCQPSNERESPDSQCGRDLADSLVGLELLGDLPACFAGAVAPFTWRSSSGGSAGSGPRQRCRWQTRIARPALGSCAYGLSRPSWGEIVKGGSSAGEGWGGTGPRSGTQLIGFDLSDPILWTDALEPLEALLEALVLDAGAGEAARPDRSQGPHCNPESRGVAAGFQDKGRAGPAAARAAERRGLPPPSQEGPPIPPAPQAQELQMQAEISKLEMRRRRRSKPPRTTSGTAVEGEAEKSCPNGR
jgi:hypothetical protein